MWAFSGPATWKRWSCGKGVLRDLVGGAAKMRSVGVTSVPGINVQSVST